MDTPTFSDWYRQAQPGLLEALLRVIDRREVAEDALDDAFEKAFTRWQRVHAMRSPGGWVYRVAVNAARQQLSREYREGERLAFATAGRQASAPPAGEAWLLVAELPTRQRTAIVLRHVGALTETEIAAAMGVTRSTVSSTLAAAYRSLARALSEPTHTNEVPPMTLSLALAITCDPAGAEIEQLADGSRHRAIWSDEVHNTIKVRPGDLVAIDGSVVVWRWWGGTVVSVDRTTAVVERHATQRDEGDPRTTQIEADVPDDLEVAVGEHVWFGTVDDRKVVVAAGAPEAVITRLAPRLPDIGAALGI